MILRSTYLHLTGIIVLFEHLFKLSFSCFYDKCWPAPSPEPSTIYLCSRILDPGILHILIDLLEEKLPFREKIKNVLLPQNHQNRLSLGERTGGHPDLMFTLNTFCRKCDSIYMVTTSPLNTYTTPNCYL